MTFQMSDKAVFEEEIMEAISFYDLFLQDIQKVIDPLSRNADLDHQNDAIRAEVTRHLLGALSAFNMRDYQEMEKHVQAALQRLHAQELVDLRDDKPRIDALIKLSVYANKAQNIADRLRKFLAQLNGSRPQ